MRTMRRGVTYLLATCVGASLVGCPDWSRPDPRLRAGGTDAGRTQGAEAPRAERAAPEPPVASSSTPTPVGLDGLRDGVLALKGSTGAPDALERLERLESLGFDLLERGTPDEQREAEALLEQLSDLRVEVVERRAGS